MNLLKTIFGGGEKNIIDEALDGLDSSTLTTQEVIEYRLKSYDKLIAFKLVQRVLAFWFCIPYVIVWCSMVGGEWLGFNTPVEVVAMLEGRMGVIVSMIVGFYFLGGTIASAQRK